MIKKFLYYLILIFVFKSIRIRCFDENFADSFIKKVFSGMFFIFSKSKIQAILSSSTAIHKLLLMETLIELMTIPIFITFADSSLLRLHTFKKPSQQAVINKEKFMQTVKAVILLV